MKKIAAAAALVGALTLGAAMQASAQQSTGANNQHALHSSTPPAATHTTTATHTKTTTTHHTTMARRHSRVSESAARSTALGAVANGRVHSHTLTRVSGRAAYVYVITVPGKPGSERVAVDAQTGRIMSQTHQAPAAAKHSAAPAHRHN